VVNGSYKNLKIVESELLRLLLLRVETYILSRQPFVGMWKKSGLYCYDMSRVCDWEPEQRQEEDIYEREGECGGGSLIYYGVFMSLQSISRRVDPL
jgi:hypothetical protein